MEYFILRLIEGNVNLKCFEIFGWIDNLKVSEMEF